MFVLWNTANGGWLTKSATYSSELDQAKRFTWVEAKAMCKARLNINPQGAGFGLIPVSMEALTEVQK